ncbi:30S ribosomal protein S20 [Candidatus Peribacteria bacterium]|nr:30S ribosomal protein S20 [Candidatus Peribacteria bacterium]
MPITSSAMKAARQAARRKQRRLPVKTTMKTLMRKVALASKAGSNREEMVKLVAQTYKAIDMAAKRNLIHWKNAARKKSIVAKLASVQ